MDEIVYNALCSYYDTLTKTGYLADDDVYKLLLLTFYRDFTLKDYRGILSREDYSIIERVLDCFYGSTCLIPYPDYLKMGKLHLGEMTEMAHRVTTLEDTNVVKVLETEAGDITSDVIIVAEEDN